MPKQEWKEFEIAVAKFVEALDPTASVIHDAKMPDIHTNTPRQRDVWVEVKVCHHFLVKIYISCKRENRKLDQQDIDAFNGEFISSGAQLGVIYSYSGFGANAIEKAKKLGISCCRLFEDEPPDIPKTLVFASSYCCTPRIFLSVVAPLDRYWKIKTWNDLFNLQFDDEDSRTYVIDAIVRLYFKGEKEAAKQIGIDRLFPPNWARSLEIVENDDKKSIKILIRGLWNIFEGRLEAYLLKGSYNFTSDEFIGTQSTPAIDTQSVHPGPGWTLLDEPPSSETVKGFIKGVFILLGGNAKEALQVNLGSKPITIEKIDLNTADL